LGRRLSEEVINRIDCRWTKIGTGCGYKSSLEQESGGRGWEGKWGSGGVNSKFKIQNSKFKIAKFKIAKFKNLLP
jgi:hypothetical protein